MKRLICTFLMVVLFYTLSGCSKNTLPQPDFPLEEDIVIAALEESGIKGFISESETESYKKDHISYTVRDETETYGDTDNKLLVAGINSEVTDGKRYLGTVFPMMSETFPFRWEDCKRQIILSTILYGGFKDEEEVYRALSDKETPEDEKLFEWGVQLSGGYCWVSYAVHDPIVSQSNLVQSAKKTYTLRMTIFESEAVYQEYMKEKEAKKEALESSYAAP